MRFYDGVYKRYAFGPAESSVLTTLSVAWVVHMKEGDVTTEFSEVGFETQTPRIHLSVLRKDYLAWLCRTAFQRGEWTLILLLNMTSFEVSSNFKIKSERRMN